NCRSLAKRGKGTCRKLEAGMSSVFDAVAAGTAINHGLSTAMNRFSTAVTDANAAGQALQQAALKAYSGLFADNLAAEHTAGAALATLYRKYGLRAKASTAKVRKAVSSLKAGRLAKGARGALRALGLTDPEIGAAARFAASLVPARPLDLVSLFRGTSQTTQMRAFQRTITLPEVRALFNALAAAGSIPAAAASTLGGDLSAAEHASTPAAARTAMTKFVANATGPKGPAVDLLRAAGAPLGA
ncbi:MAG: hypothetical protein QOI98_1900, partial [Solirubrobacteraceae bacterium]|nr:hypothetical protein [Solirubrobacteraceae bacterium]